MRLCNLVSDPEPKSVGLAQGRFFMQKDIYTPAVSKRGSRLEGLEEKT